MGSIIPDRVARPRTPWRSRFAGKHRLLCYAQDGHNDPQGRRGRIAPPGHASGRWRL